MENKDLLIETIESVLSALRGQLEHDIRVLDQKLKQYPTIENASRIKEVVDRASELLKDSEGEKLGDTRKEIGGLIDQAIALFSENGVEVRVELEPGVDDISRRQRPNEAEKSAQEKQGEVGKVVEFDKKKRK